MFCRLQGNRITWVRLSQYGPCVLYEAVSVSFATLDDLDSEVIFVAYIIGSLQAPRRQL